MNNFIQVFDNEYVNNLIKMGLKVVNKNDKFTLMALNDTVNFNKIDKTKVLFTNKMTF